MKTIRRKKRTAAFSPADAVFIRDFADRWQTSLGFPVDLRSLSGWLKNFDHSSIDHGLDQVVKSLPRFVVWEGYDRAISLHRYATAIMRTFQEASEMKDLLEATRAHSS